MNRNAHELAVAESEVKRLATAKRKAPIGSQERYDYGVLLIQAHQRLRAVKARCPECGNDPVVFMHEKDCGYEDSHSTGGAS